VREYAWETPIKIKKVRAIKNLISFKIFLER